MEESENFGKKIHVKETIMLSAWDIFFCLMAGHRFSKLLKRRVNIWLSKGKEKSKTYLHS